MNWGAATTLVLPCGKGCAESVAREVRALGLDAAVAGPAAVESRGGLAEAMRLNLWCRCAQRVLMEVAAFEASDPEELYEGAAELPWEAWLDGRCAFTVHGSAEAPGLRDGRFAMLRVKDAVADRFTARTGARPDSQSGWEGAAGVFLLWRGGVARLFLDTTGVPLSQRGYRKEGWKAPLRETLAAAVLSEAGWEGAGGAFSGPMCGSGTLAIEAAWAAQGRAPGLGREWWAFQGLKGWPEGTWRQLEEAARRAWKREGGGTWIAASDIDARAVEAARANARRAGVEGAIRWSVCDFREAEMPPEGGLVAVNPEYGERLGELAELGDVYQALGDDLKARAAGRRAAVLTGNAELAKRIGLKPSRKVAMWNGELECRLLLYELYAGTRDWRLRRKHGEMPI